MGRRARPFPGLVFDELYNRGYTDQQIAARTGLSRSTVHRHRQKMGLKSHRESGRRGCSIYQFTPFWVQCRRWMKNAQVRDAIRQACAELRRDPDVDFDYLSACMVWVLEPGPISHPEPGPYEQGPEQMSAGVIDRIMRFEEFMDSSAGSTGVPGLAIVDLVASLKSSDIPDDRKVEFARRAVLEAGLTSAYATVQSLESGTSSIDSLSALGHFWAQMKTRSLEWIARAGRVGCEVKEIRRMFRKAGLKLDYQDAVSLYNGIGNVMDSPGALSVAAYLKTNPRLVEELCNPDLDSRWSGWQTELGRFVNYYSRPEDLRPRNETRKDTGSCRCRYEGWHEAATIRRHQAFQAARGY